MQDDLFGLLRADAAQWHGLHRLFDVVAFFDVGNAIKRIRQHLFGIGVLQPSRVWHHKPATKGFVLAVFAVNGHADIHLAALEFFGGLRQRSFHRTKDHVEFDSLLAGDRLHEHQHFAIH